MPQHPLKTRIERVPLTQEVRRFLEPADHWRRVQLVLPSETVFFIDEDLDVASSGLDTRPDSGKGPGANRTYKMPPLDGDQQIEFRLAPGQWLVGAVQQGTAQLTMIVEWEEGPGA